MKTVNISDKAAAYRVVASDQRWLSWHEVVSYNQRLLLWYEPAQKTLATFFQSYPVLKDNALYREKWGRGINPRRGAKGGGLFPVLCRLQDGRLACVMRTGMNHVGPGQISISFSSDKGRTWTPYKVIVEADGYNDPRDPAFGQAQNGDLVVVYGVFDGYREGFSPNLDKEEDKSRFEGNAINYHPMEVIRSADGGETWTPPIKLSYDLGGLYLKPHGQMQRLKNGALVFNARGNYQREIHKKYPQLPERATYLFWSYDDGKTWTKQTNILHGCTETGFLELDEQHWLAYVRGHGRPPCIAHSYDAGHTWQDTEVPFPEDDRNHQTRRLPGQPTLLPNGKVIITYGYRAAPFGVRAIVSHDGGRTFDHRTEYVLAGSYFLPDCGYPSTRVFPDGTIVTVAYAISDLAHEDWNTCCIAYVYNQDVYK